MRVIKENEPQIVSARLGHWALAFQMFLTDIAEATLFPCSVDSSQLYKTKVTLP